jgi:outer membrane protein assembly factor BamA
VKNKLLFIYILLIISTYSFGNSKEKNNISQDDSTTLIINKIIITGNAKTKDKIILRELLFNENDTLTSNQLKTYISKSKDNLTNTSLFNYITINTTQENSTYTNIYILVEERWYLWPYLIFEQADRNLSAFIHNQEWSRINYGVMLVKNNFRGMAETLKFKVRLGYKEQFEIAYDIPYLGNTRKHGLSTKVSWFRQHEIPYNIQYDKLIFHKDESTYISKKFYSKLSYHFRNKHYIHHSISALYSHIQVEDTIIRLNNNYFDNSTNNTQYIGIEYNFNLDKRNYIHYPLRGYNFNFTLSQNGLNILNNEMKGLWNFESEAYYYKEFNTRWYSGFGVRGKLSSSRKQPFFIEQALGYDTYLRSFEYYVINGQQYIVEHSFIKYAIIPQKIFYLNGLNWSKFNKVHYSLYINTFFDMGYVNDINTAQYNKLPNTFLASCGVGIDLVAYYDQIIRFEYSINRFKEHGFFIHLKKAF